MSEAAEVQYEDSKDDTTGGTGLLATPAAEPPVKRPPVFRFIFMGPNGLRPGWGLLTFILLLVSIGAMVNFTVRKLHHRPAQTVEQRKAEAAAGEKPSSMLIGEGSAFALVVLTSWIMSRIERRPLGRYGFGGLRKIGRFVTGFVWGLVFLSALVGTLWKTGLLVFDGRLLFGVEALKNGAIWMVGFLLVGLSEEYLLRGYLQYTLSRGIGSLCEMLFDTRTKNSETLGFWIAALLLSLLFGLGHGNNPGESPIGLFSAGAIGAVFCFTLWKTGSLWWALGFHASWDWAQSFVFGVADSGTMVQGHLLASHPVGKVLLSGGATGPEGSAFILPILALITLVAVWTLPKREWSIDTAGS